MLVVSVAMVPWARHLPGGDVVLVVSVAMVPWARHLPEGSRRRPTGGGPCATCPGASGPRATYPGATGRISGGAQDLHAGVAVLGLQQGVLEGHGQLLVDLDQERGGHVGRHQVEALTHLQA